MVCGLIRQHLLLFTRAIYNEGFPVHDAVQEWIETYCNASLCWKSPSPSCPHKRLSEFHVAFIFRPLLSRCQGVKLDNKAALLIVEMYINTRGVGLAEAFENKCRTEYGLPPDRRSVCLVLVLFEGCESMF